MKKIIWTKIAQQERKEIFEYWNNRNKSTLYSRKLNLLFAATVSLIAQYPEIGIETGWKGIRAKTIKDYFIFYSFDNNHVYILLIWDTRWNPEKLEEFFG